MASADPAEPPAREAADPEGFLRRTAFFFGLAAPPAADAAEALFLVVFLDEDALAAAAEATEVPPIPAAGFEGLLGMIINH